MSYQRIRSSSEFQQVYGANHRTRGTLFTILVHRDRDSVPSFGIVVSRKIGKAVRRNLVKRRVRAWLRQNVEKFPVCRKIVIIAREGSAEALWNEIANDLRKSFERIRDFHQRDVEPC